MKKLVGYLSVAFFFLILAGSFLLTNAQAEPGLPQSPPQSAPRKGSISAVSPVITESGKISVSIDGLGTIGSTTDITVTSGTIQVQKPIGATVRRAFLAAASTGSTEYAITNTDIYLDGTPITFTTSTPSNIGSNNYFVEVTDLVKTRIDSAPAGLIDFTIQENNSYYIDGEALAVIFDDPNKPADNTVVIFFGAQNTAGDSFNVALGKPIDLSDPKLVVELSLGISYGFQGTDQYSQIDVNSKRLSTSAGGQDDGQPENGALITVGGIGDSSNKPTDPYALPDGDTRIDEELYNLLPFVNNGDTTILVNTLNPSNDDNIFFAVLTVGSNVAIVNEGILLGPLSATNPLGAPYTATALIQDDSGQPVAGRTVTYSVISGPNGGLTGTGVTDSSGKSTFTYTSSITGTDVLTASFVDSKGAAKVSNQVTASWTGASILTVTKSGSGSGTVASLPAGIDCGSTCSASYTSGTLVTLTAQADTGSVLSGWIGCGSTSGNSCSITITADVTITAVFVAGTTRKYMLTAMKKKINRGDGTVQSEDLSIDCGTTCKHPYFKGTTITLTATADSGSTFTGWGPITLNRKKINCSGTGPCTITMDAAKTIRATFVGPQELRVTKRLGIGVGGGTVISTPAGINCGIYCTNESAFYTLNQEVSLWASADSCSTFTRWDPPSLGCTTETCVVTMDKAHTARPVFTRTDGNDPMKRCGK
jgi:hypothetical protein